MEMDTATNATLEKLLVDYLKRAGFSPLAALDTESEYKDCSALLVSMDILPQKEGAPPGEPLLMEISVNRLLAAQTHEAEDLCFGALRISPQNRCAFIRSSRINLTPQEFALLYQMARHPNRVFSRSEIIHAVWGSDSMGDERTVDTHIKCLRAKLSRYAENIITVRKAGYLFEWPHTRSRMRKPISSHP